MASDPSEIWRNTGASTAKVVQPQFAPRNASTSNEIENLYRHVDTQINAVRSEMKGEIATVMAEITKAEAQRSKDYHALTASIDGVKGSLPTKGEMWKIVGTVVGGGLTLLGVLWGVFGAGAAITGSFADKVLERKEAQSSIESQLSEQNRLLKEMQNDQSQGSPRDGQTR